MPPVAIRFATPADAHAYGALLDAIFSENLETIVARATPHSPEQTHRFIATHDGTHSALLLAFQGDALVGSLNLTRHTRPGTQHVVALGINVVKAARGTGVAKSLMVAGMEWAKASGFAERIELEVLENNTPAIRLYERFGFTLEGRRIRSVKRDSEYLTSLMYARVLADGSHAG